MVAPRIERIGAGLLHVRRARPTTAIGLTFRTSGGDRSVVGELHPRSGGPRTRSRGRGRARRVRRGARAAAWLGDGALLLGRGRCGRVGARAGDYRGGGAPAGTHRRTRRRGAARTSDWRRSSAATAIRRGVACTLLVRRVAAETSTRSARRAPTDEAGRSNMSEWRMPSCCARAEPTLVIVGDLPRAELERAVAGRCERVGRQRRRNRCRRPRRRRPGARCWWCRGPGWRRRPSPSVARSRATPTTSRSSWPAAVVGSALREVLRRDRGDTCRVSVTPRAGAEAAACWRSRPRSTRSPPARRCGR